MCRPKEEGGRRCPAHSAARRRTGRAALRVYGSDNPITRAAVEALPSEYVHGTIAERMNIAATTTDQRIMKLAARDPKFSVVDALAENPNREEIRIVHQEHEEGEEVVKLAPSVTTLVETAPYKNGEVVRVFEGTPHERRDDFTAAVVAGEVNVDDFANDRNGGIRAVVAGHTTNPAVRDALLNDRQAKVRERAELNPHFQSDIRLVSKKKQDRLDALYAHRDRPIPDALLNDRSYEVRRLVAESTSNPAQLETLAHDTDERVRNKVLMNDKTSDNALHTLADLGHADARDSLNKKARRRGEEAPGLSAIETARINEASAASARYNAEQDARREAGKAALAIRRPFLDVARNKTSSADELVAAFNNPNADSFAKGFLARHRKSNDTMRLESLHEMGTADKSLLIDWARRATDPALLAALMKHSNKDVRDEAKYYFNKRKS